MGWTIIHGCASGLTAVIASKTKVATARHIQHLGRKANTLATAVCEMTTVRHLTTIRSYKSRKATTFVAGNALSSFGTLIDSFTVRKSAAYSGPAIITGTSVKCHAATVFLLTASEKEGHQNINTSIGSGEHYKGQSKRSNEGWRESRELQLKHSKSLLSSILLSRN